MKSKQKLLKVLDALKIEYIVIADFLKEHNSTQQVRMPRWQLRGVIANTLNLTERHQIYIWIDRLLSMNVVRLNPTSSLTKNGKYLPNSSSMYYLDFEAINENLAKNKPTTPPSNLTEYMQ